MVLVSALFGDLKITNLPSLFVLLSIVSEDLFLNAIRHELERAWLLPSGHPGDRNLWLP